MTPLEAAKALTASQAFLHLNNQDEWTCSYCAEYVYEHESDCPVPMLPQIVAALEAAQRLIIDWGEFGPTKMDGQMEVCLACDQDLSHGFGYHADDCPWKLLRRAIEGPDLIVG